MQMGQKNISVIMGKKIQKVQSWVQCKMYNEGNIYAQTSSCQGYTSLILMLAKSVTYTLKFYESDPPLDKFKFLASN